MLTSAEEEARLAPDEREWEPDYGQVNTSEYDYDRTTRCYKRTVIVDGWDFYGRGLDHQDNANGRGWCWRDTDALLNVLYDVGDKMSELMMRPSVALSRMTNADQR